MLRELDKNLSVFSPCCSTFIMALRGNRKNYHIFGFRSGAERCDKNTKPQIKIYKKLCRAPSCETIENTFGIQECTNINTERVSVENMNINMAGGALSATCTSWGGA